MVSGLSFAEPAWFLLSPLALMPAWVEWRRPRLSWPDVSGFRAMPRGFAGWTSRLPLGCRMAAVALLVLALARPQTIAGAVRLHARGVAIVLALDTSRTMTTADYATAEGAGSRLDAAKQVLARFAVDRPDDLIGLVSFANYPDTTCPPTLDHAFVVESLLRLLPAPDSEPGTSLGDALAWALRDARGASPARKVVVLVTDGQDEPGVPQPLDPRVAARLAHQLGVKLHLVYVGSEGQPPALLTQMADLAAGRLHLAVDSASLETAMREINELERSPIESIQRVRFCEWYPACLGMAVGGIVVERVLRASRWRRPI